MPPYKHWLVGPEEVGRWMLGPGFECQGSRLLPTSANGCPAFGQYRRDPGGGHAPWSLVVLEFSGDRIIGLNNFLDTSLFAAFGLPPHL
jgi:RNA polymerase sigma-70 factor (ECF subfamily)